MNINKYGLSPKGQYAKEWLKIYWYIVLACILVALFAKVFSRTGMGVSSKAPVPFQKHSHFSLQPLGGRSPLSAGGYNQCAAWPEIK